MAIPRFGDAFRQARFCGQIQTNYPGAVILEYGKEWELRTLDAIQIAAFVIIADKDWTFISADNVACNVVNHLGFKTINSISVNR